jgi:hypothetical protein
LTKIRGQQIKPLLLKTIKKSHYSVRSQAIKLLGEVDLAEAEPIAIEILKSSEKETTLILAAASVLSKSTSDAAFSTLLLALNDFHKYSWVIDWVASSAYPDATARLLDIISADHYKPNNSFCCNVIQVLGKRRDARALPRLLELWQLPALENWEISDISAAILNMADPASLEILAQGLDRQDKILIQIAAIRATLKMDVAIAYQRLAPYFQIEKLAEKTACYFAALIVDTFNSYSLDHYDPRWIDLWLALLRDERLWQSKYARSDIRNAKITEILIHALALLNNERATAGLFDLLPRLSSFKEREQVYRIWTEVGEPAAAQQFRAWAEQQIPQSDQKEVKMINNALKKLDKQPA